MAFSELLLDTSLSESLSRGKFWELMSDKKRNSLKQFSTTEKGL